jgi:4-hydroxythreonine-4-phosphate dehydrogenase
MTIALYHDQGLMAVKLVGFGRVVTLLVGLPLIRTSTGHGTAFDIAGKNVADHVNLLEAIRVAAEAARGLAGRSDRGLAAAYGRAA